MDELFLKVASFVNSFDAWQFLYVEKMILVYLMALGISGFGIVDYLGFIFYLKKSKKRLKYIREEYNFFQKLLLIHWYQNVYEKVDRFWFEIVYRCYLIHLFLFVSILILSVLSHYIPSLNYATGIVFVVHCGYMAVVCFIYFFIATKYNPAGGVMLRCAEKYQGKKWR